MQRVKNVEYDEDDVYSNDDEEEYAEGEEGDSAEEREKLTTLTPVVRAELEEAGLQASDRNIEEALWHYYWDVGKSVAYLKNARTPRNQHEESKKAKEKPKSKFDEAAEKADQLLSLRLSGQEWFRDTPWTTIPPYMEGDLVPLAPPEPLPKLLGGSSKLAKLAEERRKKAGAAQEAPNGSISSLDRLSKVKDVDENKPPRPKAEPKKYPIRKKRDATPPPKEPTPPPPEEPKEEMLDLRASPTEFGRTISTSPSHRNELADMTLKDVLGPSNAEDHFSGPSPDDVVLRAQQHSKGSNHNKNSKQSANGLAKKTEALKLDQMTPTPSPSQPKIKSKGLNVPKLWAEEKSKRKPSVAFVVIGHVDHGKSTLMGRLLLDTGAVSQRDIDKYARSTSLFRYLDNDTTKPDLLRRYKKQATELGKASFALAWVMDTGAEERERGITVDIAQHHFSTPTSDFTILDAPGHRDFVPNMIGGASMADLAVLVVDANQLESGMKGQTREHVLLARACGIERVVVAVNKLDATMPAWDEGAFERVATQVMQFLISSGFARENVGVVPCSGLSGANVVKEPSGKKGSMDWIADGSHTTLLQDLERSVPASVSEEYVKAPLRMQIADVFRGGVTNPLSVSGRITAGNVQTGDSVLVQTCGETATIRGIEVAGVTKDWVVANQICTLHLAEIDGQHLRTGDLLCSPSQPVTNTKTFVADVQALESLLPQGVDVHVGRLHVPGKIAQLVATVDAEGEVLKRKPRVIREGQRALVKVTLEAGAPLEAGEKVVLRAEGRSIAAGKIR